MVYINNLNFRNDIPIDNKYDIINDTIDDFHIVVYYLDINKCKVIIRRLDNESGWGINLKIKIYDMNEDINEILSLGSNEYNDKIININTNIKLYKHEYKNQKIPKTIIQTVSSKNIENINHYNSILTFIELNPEYKYVIYDDNESRKFIKDNFDERTLVAYDLLIPGAFKADFFRYCILYINGGCYFDCKQILRVPLRKIIDSDDEFILCRDMSIGYFNAVMMSQKENSNLLKTIEDCKTKIFNFEYYFNIYDRNFNSIDNFLNLTGPKLIYYSIHNDIDENKVVKFYHLWTQMNHNYQNLCIKYNDKLIITKNYNTHIPQNHYSDLWRTFEILYKNYKIFNDYKFYIYSHQNRDIFDFYIINNNSFIMIRNDDNSGWGYNYKLKIIDEIKNTVFYIDSGVSDINYKIINFKFNNIEENLIKSYKNSDKDYNLPDRFDLFLVNQHNLYKLIIIRTDLVSGWGQELKLIVNIKNKNKNYNIDIGSSEKVIKIIDISI